MSATDHDVFAVGDRLFAAIEAGDLAAVAACYGPDTIVWHNYDEIEQAASDNLTVLEWMTATVADRRYEVVRREPVPGGFVQQHVLHGTVVHNGAPLRLPACMVVAVRDGVITRIDEYLDTAQLAPLLTR